MRRAGYAKSFGRLIRQNDPASSQKCCAKAAKIEGWNAARPARSCVQIELERIDRLRSFFCVSALPSPGKEDRADSSVDSMVILGNLQLRRRTHLSAIVQGVATT